MTQLALPLQLADHAVFRSFHDNGNEALVATLQRIADGADRYGGWLWGGESCGKTHLLQAVCARAGDRAAYVPLSVLRDAGPEMLDGLATRELICIDDIDQVAASEAWEGALFALFNELQDVASTLLVSATSTPRESRFELPDLRSRMSRLPVFQIAMLDEQQRAAALQLRSRHRGLELPTETALYLLRRSRRDMTSLYALLDRLDKAALRAKRRLTIPFVREVLESASETGRD